MVTTSRKFALIIRSRTAASPFLIFAACSISCCGVKRGIRPISRRYLFNPVSLSFMIRTYSLERTQGYCARVGIFGAPNELVVAIPLEMKIATLPTQTRSEDDSFMKLWAWDEKNLPSIAHAIRTAVAATASVLIARLVQMPEAYWAAIATLVVMQSTLGATLTLSLERIVATAVGASVGALEANYFGANLVAYALAIVLTRLLSIAFRLEKTAYRYASVTLTIIVLIPRLGAPWTIALHRFIEVSVGIMVALAVVAVWPEHRRLSPNSAAE